MEDIIRTCGLSEVAHRLIGHLSKGYRQRVGVAQSLCGNPKVLVLDEPTVGLDPRQVVEIRALIADLGKTHTVIFSSHLLSEIQQLCQRVLILNRGHLEYEADMQELAETGETLRLRASIAMREKQLIPALRSLPCVRRVKALPTRTIEVSEVLLECDASAVPDAQTQLFRLLCGLDAPIRMLVEEHDSLETVFLRATDEGAESSFVIFFVLIAEGCFYHRSFSRCAGISPLRRRPKGNEKSDEVCDRPLETFGAFSPMLLEFYRKLFFLGVTRGRSMDMSPIESRERVKERNSLAGCRDSVPAGVQRGNAPCPPERLFVTMRAIWKRELQAYFLTPTGYVFMGVFLLLSSVMFYLQIMQARSSDLPTFVGQMSYLWMLLSPVLTMRLLAEERQRRTDRCCSPARFPCPAWCWASMPRHIPSWRQPSC